MTSLATTLQGKRSAVLRSGRSAQEVLAVGRQAGWRLVDLELTGPTDKAAFLDLCANAFDLPDWFGHNWDALADCLDDIQDEPGVLVAFAGAEHLSAPDREVIRDIFDERVDLGPHPFVVVAATGT
ncbi:barstar family protein [Yimella sp. cx-573]|nr:barstar family protein [Yimella sp. cx-573]